ncbi:SurA N-terminal domain-containing protein [Anaerobacillus sp. MEB173]|uniref:SurA N-terminal domain-containing protein n=1 Tax=Anaerobacillus sp. MEB173 TaxID=3383345 RepID=UPI003F9045B5
MNKKWLLGVLLAVLLAVVAGCGGVDESAEENNDGTDVQEEETVGDSDGAPEDGEGNEQMEMPEPDLEGIPDVVAEVNGEEISKEEFVTTYEGQFMQLAMQSQMFGQEVDQEQLKQQIAESLVGQKLLIQEAEKAGFEASEEDINETLDGIAAQNGLASKEEFLAALAEQGMDEDEVMSQVELQVKVDKLIASESGDIQPTNEEIEEYYNMVVAQQEQMGGEDVEIPSFEEIKPQLEEEVKNQKRAEGIQALVEKLTEEGDVTIYL